MTAQRGFATIVVQGRESAEPEGPRTSRPHAPPLYQTSGFRFPDSAAAVAAFRGSGDYLYTRHGNPTVRGLERRVAALEAYPVEGAPVEVEPGTVEARFFASGMGAISAVALAVARGGRLVCQDGIYGSTVAHLEGLREYGIRVDFVPPGDVGALAASARDDPPPALLFVETPANPRLQVTDLRAAAGVAAEVGAVLAVDATFATPAFLRPLAWGADLVVHSTTKFLGGHGLALGGIVCGRSALVAGAIDSVRKFFGAAPDPFAAWLTLIGLQTLAVRMERHARNARLLAQFLREHEGVSDLFYPDTGDSSGGESRQMSSGGPMVSFVVEGGAEAALRVIDRLRLARLVPTLGTVDTLVQHPYTMSHGLLPEGRKLALGIDPGLIRVSVGLEDAGDIVDDFRQALTAAEQEG